MSSDMSNILGRIKDTWRNSSPALRWASAGLSAAVVAAIGATIWFNQPSWVVLINQAPPKEAAAIVSKLDELKVANKPTGDGYTIMVQEKDLYAARLALAQANLPKGEGGGTGFEWFDQPKFGATEFDRKVNYLRAQQTELARALVRINSIESADVRLAIPDQTVFTRDQKPVTAAVLLRPKAGEAIPAQQVLGIVNFVAKSIQGLTPENVTVVDDKGRLLSNGAADSLMASGTSDDQNATSKAQEEMRVKYERNVQTLLEPLFGAGNVVAKVHLELTHATSKTESTIFGNNVAKQQDSSIESGTATTNTGTTNPPGADPNRPTTPGSPPTYQAQPAKDGKDDTYKNKTSTVYEVSKEQKVVLNAAGELKKLTVGVVVNREDLTPDQIKMVRDTVAGATGTNAGDISVTAMKFNQQIPADLKAAQDTAAANGRANTVAMGLGGLALLFVLGFIWSRRGRTDIEDGGIAYDQPIQAGDLMAQALGSHLDVKLEHVALQGDGTAGEDQAMPTYAAIPQESKLDTDSEVDREIQRIITEEPGSVAAMLSNWLKS